MWATILQTPAVSAATTAANSELPKILANPSDWRAIAGILFLAWLTTFAALLRERSLSRADARAKDEWVERTAISVNKALEENATAKAETAAALNSLASAQQGWMNIMARVETELGRRRR